MKTIKVEIEISGIDGWGVDWSSPEEVEAQLDSLKTDIANGMNRACGILKRNLSIECKLSNH